MHIISIIKIGQSEDRMSQPDMSNHEYLLKGKQQLNSLTISGTYRY